MRRLILRKEKLSHRERLQACLSDQSSLDRPPVALWRHFPVDDQEPETLSAATVAFQSQFDFDIVKVTPASSFCLKDWGAEDIWEGNTEGTRRYVKNVINAPRDWGKLPILHPRKSTFLSAQLECIKQIRTALPDGVPIIQTIFSPLAQAKNLVGKEKLKSYIRRFPEAVMEGVTIIAKTTKDFLEELLETGIDGIFFAVQHAQADDLSIEEFVKFEVSNNTGLLESTNSFWCNILHLHGREIRFDLISSLFPLFQIINWHDRETPPTLSEAQRKYNLTVCGGISQKTILFGSPQNNTSEAEDAYQQTNTRKFILGTGCVIPIITPYGNIMAVRRSVVRQK